MTNSPYRCPRCGNLLVPERDNYGSYLDCISCGNHIEQDVALPTVGQNPLAGVPARDYAHSKRRMRGPSRGA